VSQTSPLSTICSREVLQIEQVCDRFEAAWKAGRRPRLESYLDGVAAPLDAALLRHLVALDWEYRLLAGEKPQAADYLTRFPAVGPAIEAIGREVAAATTGDGRVAQPLGLLTKKPPLNLKNINLPT
jgi:hypothetical protein